MTSDHDIAAPCAPNTRGSALIEALVALAFMLLAGGVLAAAAMVSLRATRRTAALEQLTAVAARELAVAEARDPPAGVDEAMLTAPGLGSHTVRRLEVTRDDEGIATFNLMISAPGLPTVHLVARTLANE